MHDAGSVLRVVLARHNSAVLLNTPKYLVFSLAKEELVEWLGSTFPLLELLADVVAKWTTFEHHDWQFHVHRHFHVRHCLRLVVPNHDAEHFTLGCVCAAVAALSSNSDSFCEIEFQRGFLAPSKCKTFAFFLANTKEVSMTVSKFVCCSVGWI